MRAFFFITGSNRLPEERLKLELLVSTTSFLILIFHRVVWAHVSSGIFIDCFVANFIERI